MIRPRHPGRILCLAALLGLLAACAPQIALPRHDDAATDLAAFRTRFLAKKPAAHGLAVRATLLYATPDRANRTDIQLYGDYARPLRLDVRAGIGTMLALMREDAGGLLAFYPGDSKAYAHPDPVVGAQLLGLPFPFSLRDLALVISGSFSSLVPAQPAEMRKLPDGGFALSFAAGPVRSLTLDAYGRPERMEGELSPYFRTRAERDGAQASGPRTWTLGFSHYPEDSGDPAGPARVLTLSLPKGESAVLRIRALTPHPAPWPERSLALTLPANTGYISLEQPAADLSAPSALISGGGKHESGTSEPGQQDDARPRR